ncbi:histidine phosphatase family protein [Staphylococcus simiae]|uniref:histidine phosphatase family protein n=1 Tax=Staphylococcus simiae TaxID=308354 RepID=UPI001A95C521|nr:histidine phosphatase family protein [Staphylococcus simiae]MBO1199306.1 histidine phosphatase family protein [Staphylococcus simiae]MBO1201539.1 histidine phosphatase family protein [Staphylococcus simiae]MBO1203714.1 histidine phosphatase family protein [Staphylococcus simiae]MBO1211321.1 histidine phosphatase family protein [Staphylococcus simiae]MBO1229920.1 histidine phosphatase family protein [Staphylococcus simiae]
MTIYLVRHGESQSNYDNKHFRAYYCGQLDVPLTDKGKASAAILEEYFKALNIKHIYVSDLYRTRQTYEHIFPNTDIDTTITDQLRERSLGQFEGKYKDDISMQQEYEKYFNDPMFNDFRHSFSQKAPGGESYQDVLNRVQAFMDNEVNDKAQQGDIVIIAHQVVIRCLMHYFGQVSKDEAVDLNIENCKPYVIA